MNFQTHLEKYSHHFQNRLKIFLKKRQKTSSRLLDAIYYSVLNGGKHIRPLLVYCSGESLGIQTEKLDAIAIAIELIHAYSLIHDDLPAMDNAKIRRGQPCCHIKFGEAETILAGDALQMLAIDAIVNTSYLSDRQKIKLIHLLTTVAGYEGMVGGQSLDIQAEKKHLDIEKLREIHYLKTGKLIAACVMMPASLKTNLPVEELEKISILLGLAYQIQDDLLDVESSTELLGKEQGIDEKLSKNTYPKLLGLAATKDYLATIQYEIQAFLNKINLNESQLSQLIDYIFQRQF